MKPSKRLLVRLAIGLGCVVLAVGALSVWNKHDFCRGWANHYAARAMQLRLDAAAPALDTEQRREYLMAADWHDIIAGKYGAVASQPWRPYPGYPLITPDEQRLVAARY